MLRRFRPYMAEFSKIPLLKTRGARWSVCCAVVVAGALAISVVGCGRIISQKATDQLIAGDAVDRTISQIDFRVLMGKKVFLDTQFVNKTVPGVGFVNSEYMISSVRQKMMCDGCLLQEKTDDADFIVEMRIGALGADGHEVIYGMPPNNYLSIAASVVPASPQAAAAIPSMPELSLAKKDDQMAAAKIALFAYNRHTREPIWQSGISESRSLVADRWFFGAGPYHKGNIYGTKKQPDEPSMFGSMEDEEPTKEYFVERRFADPNKSLADVPPGTKPAAAAVPAPAPVAAATPAAPAKSVASATSTATAAPVAAAAPATTPATATTTAAAAPASPPATAAAATTSIATPPGAAAQPAAANVVNSSLPPADPSKGTATSSVPASTNGAPTTPTKTTALPSITTPTTGSASPPAGTPTQPAQTVSSSSP
jgi:hypothetical protein